MQAIRLERAAPTDTPTISLETVPIPKATEDHVVVKIKAAAIQPSDRLNARGGFDHTTFPRTPGRDFAGVIVDGPPEVLHREVFGTGGALLGYGADGAHAEYCLVHKSLMATKPSNVSFVEAAAVGVPFTTAYLCLRRGRATSNDTVLVIGSTGAVGSAAVQIAEALGVKKVYTAARRDTTNVNTATDPTFSALDKLTDGKGVDVIVDTVGSFELMSAAARHLAQRGRYTWISAPRGPGAATEYGINLIAAYRNEWEFVGCNSAAATPEEVGADLEKLGAMIAAGSIHTPKEGSLEQTSLTAAIETFQTGKKLQIVVMP